MSKLAILNVVKLINCLSIAVFYNCKKETIWKLNVLILKITPLPFFYRLFSPFFTINVFQFHKSATAPNFNDNPNPTPFLPKLSTRRRWIDNQFGRIF